MSDAYRELIENLREAVVQPSDGGEATRQRILRDLAPVAARPRVSWKLVLVAAAISLSTAFALYVAGSGEPNAVRTPRGAGEQPAVSAGTASGSPVAPVPSHAPDTLAADAATRADADASASGPKTPPPQAGARPRTTRTPSPRTRRQAVDRGAPAQPTAPEPAASMPITDAQRQALYYEAHRLHFRGAPQRALEAWDAYLATDPSGPLRLEAEYNRAVVLTRLGRNDEARRALTPFASGAHGGFRRADAQQLLLQLQP